MWLQMTLTLSDVRLGSFHVLVNHSGLNGAFKKAAPLALDGFLFPVDVDWLLFLIHFFFVTFHQNLIKWYSN